MNSTKIKDYVVAILTKSKSINEIPIKHVEKVKKVLQKMATVGNSGIIGVPNDSVNTSVVKEEFVKIDEMGQWSIEKPDPSTMSKPQLVQHINKLNSSGQQGEARRLYDKHISGGGAYTRNKPAIKD